MAQAEDIDRQVRGAWSSGRAGSACQMPPPDSAECHPGNRGSA